MDAVAAEETVAAEDAVVAEDAVAAEDVVAAEDAVAAEGEDAIAAEDGDAVVAEDAAAAEDGSAIRKGTAFNLVKPTIHDLIEDSDLRMYNLQPDGTTLTEPSLNNYVKAKSTYEKRDQHRRDEEAKVCHPKRTSPHHCCCSEED